MIEIFKTDVQNKTQAKRIMDLLKGIFSDAHINFDLGDCDKILRVQGVNNLNAQVIVINVNQLGFQCEILN